MSFSFTSLLVLVGLFLLQLLLAYPWIRALRGSVESAISDFNPTGNVVNLVVVVLVGAFLVPFGLLFFVQEKDGLQAAGQFFGAVLQFQLILDFFVLGFAFLLRVWPKGGAVALAAFREGVRQPMFWLLFLICFALLTIYPFVPYFTFGEDHIMVKEMGFDTIMFFALAFGALAAGLSISEEIEGRTAVTLMSKPVSRRQFLLGKFFGILMAALVMISLLGIYFEGTLIYKHWFDKLDPEDLPGWVVAAVDATRLQDKAGEAADFLRGIGLWANLTLETLPGLVLNLVQVMVLLSFAVSLATRLPLVVNLSTVLVIYFLAHLAPVLVEIGKRAQQTTPGPVAQMLSFMANLFDTLLPGLEFFRVGPALVGDAPLATGEFFRYVGSVSLYGVLYTAIVLLVGLILFEDRDLA